MIYSPATTVAGEFFVRRNIPQMQHSFPRRWPKRVKIGVRVATQKLSREA